MSDEFSTEPIVGHHVGAERYEPESKLSDVLDEIAEEYGISRRNRERIRLTVGDVDWDETKEVSIHVDTFEKIIEWYESQCQ